MSDREHRWSVTRQATLLGLSRGSVYYLPQPTSAADLALMRRFDELLELPRFGGQYWAWVFNGIGCLRLFALAFV